jgi:hypothetical protein
MGYETLRIPLHENREEPCCCDSQTTAGKLSFRVGVNTKIAWLWYSVSTVLPAYQAQEVSDPELSSSF